MKYVFLLAALAAPGLAHATQATGHLRCAVIDEALDWNKRDLHGNLSAMGVEICHAVAAALYGDTSKADLQSYHAEQDGLDGFKKGFTDIIVGVTPSSYAAMHFGVRFSLPFFHDGQGFMVHKDAGVHGIADMADHKLCTIDDTDNDPIAMAVLAHHGVRPIPFGFQEEGEMDAAIMDRHCQIASAYLSKLAEARGSFIDAKDFVFLPDVITLSPVTVAVDVHDPRLSAIVDATINLVLQAEALGVTRASMPKIASSDDPRIERLTGENWGAADALALPHDWSRHVIEAVGNYAEIYDRTVGPGTPMNLPRGLNALWTNGGIMAPQPLQ